MLPQSRRYIGNGVKTGKIFFQSLLLLLAVGCAPALLVDDPRISPSQQDASAAPPPSVSLDRDGSDGYSGDFVLIYYPDWIGGRADIGSLDGLVETGARPFPLTGAQPLRTDPALYQTADPCVSDPLLAADGPEDTGIWQEGYQRVFYLHGTAPENPAVLFRITAEGERCRVWSPVNPDYGPLEVVDPVYPKQLALAMDEALLAMEADWGGIPDPRGDGKANLLCYDLNHLEALAYTDMSDIFEEILDGEGELIPGNGLPSVHVGTGALLQGQYDDISDLYSTVIHELHHLSTFLEMYPEGAVEGYFTQGTYRQQINSLETIFLMELLAIAAQEKAMPGSFRQYLPWWYSGEAVWEDIAGGQQPFYLRDSALRKQSGHPLLSWGGRREDYAAVALLAHFVENRAGWEAFPAILEQWQRQGCSGRALDAVQAVLGYSDFQVFFEDFLLAILLHDAEAEGGRYRLEPFAGYEGEDPFDHLVPIVTESRLNLMPEGYIVIRPTDGIYIPPDSASERLRYVGVTK